MARPPSKIAPGWWDYTTVDAEILEDAAKLTPDDMLAMSRDGFEVVFYDTLEQFYLAEALEYVEAWKQATPDRPAGICGPIGPTEQLPLVAEVVNATGLKLDNAHFWGMDEWIVDGKRHASIRSNQPLPDSVQVSIGGRTMATDVEHGALRVWRGLRYEPVRD